MPIYLLIYLVCCVAVRNCLECRQRQREKVNKSSLICSKTQETLQGISATTTNKVQYFLLKLH